MAETSSSESTSTKLAWIAHMARRDASFCFTNLAHLLTIEHLHEAHRRVRRDGAAGVDGVVAEQYGRDLDANLAALHRRLRSGTYRAPPVRRVYIPKGRGKRRPIGIPTYEDKLVQRAVVMLLEPVYEQDFRACSYGFRPRRSAHHALDSLWHTLMKLGGQWVLDVDLKDFFGSLDHSVIQTLLQERIGDRRIQRLIGKWLRAGVMEAGRRQVPTRGTPQGGVISPLLANIVLHHVLDTWFEGEVKPRLSGPAELVRFADDFVLVFRLEEDARRVARVLPKRLARFGLAMNEEKSRLVRFQRPYPNERKPRRGARTNGTFDFLGFTLFWGRARAGFWVVQRKTAKARFSRAVTTIARWCRYNRHLPIGVQYRLLCQKVRGHYAYYGVRGNYRALNRFRLKVLVCWHKWLGRRSQRAKLSRTKRDAMAARWPLPLPRITAFSSAGMRTI